MQLYSIVLKLSILSANFYTKLLIKKLWCIIHLESPLKYYRKEGIILFAVKKIEMVNKTFRLPKELIKLLAEYGQKRK